MATGFGNAPVHGQPQGLRADPPQPSTPDDLHAIRQRYCGPKTINVQSFSLAANAAVRYDLTGTPINGFLLTTATGQANVYIGDFTSGSGKAAVTPHVVGSASVVANTQFIPLPPAADYIITIQEGAGSTTTGTFIPVYQ